MSIPLVFTSQRAGPAPPAATYDDGEADFDEDEEEEITLAQWLQEQLQDKRTIHQLWTCGKTIFLFGATIWLMRKFPHFGDPEKIDNSILNFMEHQHRLLG